MGRLLLGGTVAMSGPAISGHSAFEAYGTQIFHMIGFAKDTSADLTIGLYAVRLATSLPAFLWVDSMSRRSLLGMGLSGMSVCYAIAGLSHQVSVPSAAAGSILLSAAAFQAGVAPLSWIIPTELFPADMRMKGSTISSTV